MTKAASVPNQAVTGPPTAAPSVSIADQVTEEIALAETNSRSLTMDGIAAERAGSKNEERPSCKTVRTYTSHTCSGLRTKRKPRTTTARATSLAIISVRRLKRSAKTPDSGPKITLGRKRATITNATARPEPVNLRTSVKSAMVSNQSPNWLTTCPSHIRRKSRLRRSSSTYPAGRDSAPACTSVSSDCNRMIPAPPIKIKPKVAPTPARLSTEREAVGCWLLASGH